LRIERRKEFAVSKAQQFAWRQHIALVIGKPRQTPRHIGPPAIMARQQRDGRAFLLRVSRGNRLAHGFAHTRQPRQATEADQLAEYDDG